MRHREWFPVSYDQDFYKKSVAGTLYSLVAAYGRHGTCEEILGMITMSRKLRVLHRFPIGNMML